MYCTAKLEFHGIRYLYINVTKLNVRFSKQLRSYDPNHLATHANAKTHCSTMVGWNSKLWEPRNTGIFSAVTHFYQSVSIDSNWVGAERAADANIYYSSNSTEEFKVTQSWLPGYPMAAGRDCLYEQRSGHAPIKIDEHCEYSRLRL